MIVINKRANTALDSLDEIVEGSNIEVKRKILQRDVTLVREAVFYSSLEQEGEHLHQVLNSLETRFKSVYNKQERYFLILGEL